LKRSLRRHALAVAGGRHRHEAAASTAGERGGDDVAVSTNDFGLFYGTLKKSGVKMTTKQGLKDRIADGKVDLRLSTDVLGRLCRCVRRPQHLAHWVRLLRRGINLEITWFRQSFS
jgi:hypothetical protein